ncbi:hypothetical protein HETIRDRAFT_385295 [Heterobasidion irregulare TC 32-1]|uniref:Uncharacterized protein n=1 Tax=Heterobasidion irregulare (strain TC 32-1) TaxID=747525 RepID=W4K4E2_HETIT|nr:uncharacterized protein HETIRDRAFT_385295 [Heterobasidion irregulare TC 32-1]ETW80677.1 hypothetical protein HETIRDRAFT_385295 [Heterobasidion irregulare TC 32-1]
MPTAARGVLRPAWSDPTYYVSRSTATPFHSPPARPLTSATWARLPTSTTDENRIRLRPTPLRERSRPDRRALSLLSHHVLTHSLTLTHFFFFCHFPPPSSPVHLLFKYHHAPCYTNPSRSPRRLRTHGVPDRCMELYLARDALPMRCIQHLSHTPLSRTPYSLSISVLLYPLAAVLRRSPPRIPYRISARAGPTGLWPGRLSRSVGHLERWCDEPPSSTSRHSSYPYPEYLPYPLLRPECCIMPSSPSYIYITQWSSSPGPSLSLHLPGSFHMFLGLRLSYPRTPRGSPTIYSS